MELPLSVKGAETSLFVNTVEPYDREVTFSLYTWNVVGYFVLQVSMSFPV